MSEDLPLERSHFDSDIVMGERYRDKHTGFEGVATSITFYEESCERVVLEGKVNEDGKSEAVSFDAPRLVHVETGKVAKVAKTGGPGDIAAPRPIAQR